MRISDWSSDVCSSDLRLGFIATKDGYADAHFDEALDDEDGFSNIAFGFKYAILSDPESESLLTAGLRYEIPLNDLETGGIELQGEGDGSPNTFVTRSEGHTSELHSLLHTSSSVF